MPGFVPIPPTTPTPGQPGPLASLAGMGELADGFTMLLSGLLHSGRGSAVRPPVTSGAAELPTATSGKSRQLANSVQAEADNGVILPRSGSTPVSPSDNILEPAGQTPVNAGKARDPGGPVPDRFGRGADHAGKARGASGQASDPSSRTANLAGQDRVPATGGIFGPSGPLAASSGIVTAATGQVANVPGPVADSAVAREKHGSGRTAMGVGGTVDGAGKGSEIADGVQNAREQTNAGPEGTTPSGTPALSSWPLASPESTPSDVSLPGLGLGGTAASTVVDPHRPAWGGGLSSRPDDKAATAPPLAMSVTGAKAGKIVARPEPVFEMDALAASSNVEPAVPITTASSSPVGLAAGQPADTARTAPVDQITPILVGLLKTADGAQTVTVRLQPAELGQVQIRVDQTTAGAPHVDIMAERPETLALLQRDEPRLQQALDQAGVLSNGRSVSFQMATPGTIDANLSRPDNSAAGSGGSGQGQSGGAWRQSADGQQDSGGGSGTGQGQPRTQWFRAGLDITA